MFYVVNLFSQIFLLVVVALTFNTIEGRPYYDPYYDPYYQQPYPIQPYPLYPPQPYPPQLYYPGYYPNDGPMVAAVESEEESFDPVEAERTLKKATAGTRSLADIVDDMDRGQGGDLLNNMFNQGGNGQGLRMDTISKTIRGTADIMEGGTQAISKLVGLFNK